eukprot:SAG11_NODE_351_length_10384_cov_4.708896_2_plen_2566_part_01
MLDYVISSGRPFMLPHPKYKFSFFCRVMKMNGDDFVDVECNGIDVGEVWIRGDTVFESYWQNEKATSESFIESEGVRWFKTGDLAFCDARKVSASLEHCLTASSNTKSHIASPVRLQYLTITDRAKDMILVGAENVYSVEVERALQDHPDVVHACVYGIPDTTFGEAVKAVIQLKHNTENSMLRSTRRKLQIHCQELLADFKLPTQYQFVEVMPLTGSGKVAKSVVRKQDQKLSGEASLGGTTTMLEPEVLLNDTYRVSWSIAPARSGNSNLRGGCWLIVADEKGVASNLLEQMKSVHADVKCISGEALTDDSFVETLPLDIAGVVFLPSLDAYDTTLDLRKTVDGVTKILASALACVHGMDRLETRLWLVTRGAAVDAAVPAGMDNAVSASQQALWGFARVVCAEKSQLKCHILDLCPCEEDAAMDAQSILQELMLPFAGDKAESAWRARIRYISQLDHLQRTQFSSPPTLYPNASYVITGGTGGLGPHLAERLIKCGARHVILTGRREPSSEFKMLLNEKEKLYGVTFGIELADVGIEAAVHKLLRRVSDNYPPCRGIFHLAGLEGSDYLTDPQSGAVLPWSRFEHVLLPKVQGSMFLHHFAAEFELPLDYFVLFSSVYGLLGRAQLGHYAAANAFQDGLAHARRMHNLPAVAVSWGTWAGAGMAHRFGKGFETMWQNEGMRFVELEHGMATLASVLDAGVPHVAVLPADWSQYGRFIQRRQNCSQPLPRELVRLAASSVADISVPSVVLSAAAQEIMLSPEGDRGALVLSKVIECVQNMGIPGDNWDPEQNVTELGLTSNNIVELANELADMFGIDVAPTIVYERIHLRGISGKILEECRALIPVGISEEAPVLLSAAAQEIMLSPEGDRGALVLSKVIECVQNMGIPGDNWDPEQNVTELGLTSNNIVELANELADMFGIDVAPTIVYERIHLRGISGKILEGLQIEVGTRSVARTHTNENKDGTSDDQSEDRAFAIVGVGCRLPGRANSPSSFWANLEEKTYSVVDAPTDRPNNGRPSGYLSAETVSTFDAELFHISSREASSMDPQQRLLLQVSHDALEDAGIVHERIEDRHVGVFVGISAVDYGALMMEQVQAKVIQPTAYSGTSWSISIAANRLSYVYHFQGPSIALDTACSSSLVAMDIASKAMHAGQCSMAIIAGVNLQFRPVWSTAFVQAGMLSPTNKCKFGDNSADGYVRGEGCGAVLLKPRQRAKDDGNPVYGVVVNTAVNQDGHSNGLTAPNPAAQESLLTTAYRGLDVADVAHIEAHGTGTRLGDPIELDALYRSLRRPVQSRSNVPPLRLASVKSNIGHLECAAGMAGLIKSTLLMHHNMVLPSLHFEDPNVLVQWEKWNLRVMTENQPLGQNGVPAILGCSGFGFGGTNAHVVMRQDIFDEVDEENRAPVACEPYSVISLSSHTIESVQATAGRYAESAAQQFGRPMVSVRDISRLSTLDRLHNSQRHKRAAVIADDLATLGARMDKIAAATGQSDCKPADGTILGSIISKDIRLVLLFTGQGSSYPEMGKDLYRRSRAFKGAMDQCDLLFRSEADDRLNKGLVYSLYHTHEAEQQKYLSDAAFSQPALFAVEYALAQVFIHEIFPSPAGVDTPECMVAVMGHSLGEITAACVADVLTLKDACLLAAGRGKAMSQVPEGMGAMAACRASRAVVQELLKTAASDACIAAVNGPTGVVVSGSVQAVDAAVKVFESNKIRARKLNVSHGFHSSQIQPALQDLHRIASKLRPRSPSHIKVISNLTGKLLETAPDAEYWVNHARHAVQFMDGVVTAITDLKCNVMVEIGPQPHLSPHAERVAQELQADVLVVRSLRQGKDEIFQIMSAIGCLFVGGVPINWTEFHRCGLGHDSADQAKVNPQVRLPTTAPGGQRHWDLKDVDVFSDRNRVSNAASEKRLEIFEDEIKSQLLFTTEWIPQPLPTPQAQSSEAQVLVLCDESKLSEDLCRKMQQTSAYVYAVQLFSERAKEQDDASLREQIKQEVCSKESWDLVVFARGLKNNIGIDDVSVEQNKCCMAFMNLLQVVLESPNRCARIMILTRGVHVHTDITTLGKSIAVDADCVVHAPLWGIAKSARLELPLRLMIKAVDFSIQVPVEEISKYVAAEAIDDAFGSEDILIHPGVRLVQRIQNQSKMGATIRYLAPAGSIALTGGNGALGLLVADWLATRGARRLLLISRSGRIRPELQDLWSKIQARQDLQIELLAYDVSDLESMDQFLSRCGDDLQAVFHCAGVLDDKRLAKQDRDSFERVFMPKAGGALNLHRVLCDRVPDCSLVMFSSVTSLMGNIGQTNYGAANAFLDALAGCRRVMGLRGVSLQWGPWAEVGMAATLQHRMVWSPLPNTDGLSALDSALVMTGIPLLAITRFNHTELSALLTRTSALRNFFDRSIHAQSVLPIKSTTATKASPTNPSAAILACIKETARKFLKTDIALEDTAEIEALGLDSIDGMEFVRDLSDAFGISLSPNVIFEVETLIDLKNQVIHEIGSAHPSGTSVPQAVFSQTGQFSAGSGTTVTDAGTVMARIKETARKFLKTDIALEDTAEIEALGLDSIDGM